MTLFLDFILALFNRKLILQYSRLRFHIRDSQRVINKSYQILSWYKHIKWYIDILKAHIKHYISVYQILPTILIWVQDNSYPNICWGFPFRHCTHPCEFNQAWLISYSRQYSFAEVNLFLLNQTYICWARLLCIELNSLSFSLSLILS